MDYEELIIAVADVAAIIREARAAGLPPRAVCPMACPDACYVRWGAGRTCASCGGPVLPALTLHSQLVKALSSQPRPTMAERSAA